MSKTLEDIALMMKRVHASFPNTTKRLAAIAELKEKEMHYMLDIETLGTKPGSVITQIACVKFDPYALRSPEQSFISFKEQLSEVVSGGSDAFNFHIDVRDCLNAGLTMDYDTLEWRIKNGHMWQEGLTLRDVIIRVTNRLADTGSGAMPRFWANSPNFDMVMIEQACRAVGLSIPWHFRNLRDLRTLLEVSPVGQTVRDMAWAGLHAHDALDDCIGQARMVAIAYYKIGQRPYDKDVVHPVSEPVVDDIGPSFGV